MSITWSQVTTDSKETTTDLDFLALREPPPAGELRSDVDSELKFLIEPVRFAVIPKYG